MERRPACSHTHAPRAAHAGVTVTACPACAGVQFDNAHGRVNARVALGLLFGEFDLVGRFDAVGAPGREVLTYRAPDRLTAAALRVVEPNQWFSVDQGLWMCHDGQHLLFAHDHPNVSHLVGA